ncbi:guanine nucleotide binding protein, alpha subunit [Cyathus striatus]|nr:guanine nucleotide binding protein, alpha subunit [Cyathus striatus]
MTESDPESVRISTMIDEELKKESAKRKEAQRREVKVMLLGQAESGKSTLQKQFQLYYASKTLEGERPSWRPVVYFNIIKAVRMMLGELDACARVPADEPEDSPFRLPEIQEQIAALRMQLLPLVAMEESLASALSGGVSIRGRGIGAYVRSGWQTVVGSGQSAPSEQDKAEARLSEAVRLAGRTISSCVMEIKALWGHAVVQYLLQTQRLRLEDSAPFFLTNVQRVAEPDYLPTTDDILNVRLQTLGVMEHSFPINMGGSTYNWKLYDVGGARAAWVPYFDDATAIIFLAPMSAFDQGLEEDPRTNRIEDSLQLWSGICENGLLKSAHLVLLLNKVDLLKKKLDSGISVRKHITSYGERPNEYGAVSEYFRSHFIQIYKRKDTSKRPIFVHFTSMLKILHINNHIKVGEAIIRKHITQTGLA